MTDETKLRNMILAHLDGVYVLSARENCDELVTQLINENAAKLKAKDELLAEMGLMLTLLGTIFFYGNFKVETQRESELWGLMNKHGFAFKNEDECIEALAKYEQMKGSL